MSIECPHCDEDIKAVIRTGDKRFSCSECNKVIKYDTVEEAIDSDKINWGPSKKYAQKMVEAGQMPPDVFEEEFGEPPSPPDGGGGSSSSSGGQSQQQHQPQQQQPQSPEDPGSHDFSSNRELILQRGKQGLDELKQDSLEEWLDVADGVGGKTKSRIMMLFERNERYRDDPEALYSMLDDQTTASPAYINSMVDSIFAPERENQDILQERGYNSWFASGRNSNNMPMQQGPGQGYNGNMQQQPMGGMPQHQGQQHMGPQQNQHQMSQQPPQNQGRGGHQQPDQQNQGMSVEEGIRMIQEMQKAEEAKESENDEPSGIQQARDKAVINAANNVGGFFGTIQEVFNESLVNYFRENPEKLVENSDFIMKFMESSSDNSEEKTRSPNDAAVDNAISSIGSGNQQQSMPNRQGQMGAGYNKQSPQTQQGYQPQQGGQGYNPSNTPQPQTPQQSQQPNTNTASSTTDGGTVQDTPPADGNNEQSPSDALESEPPSDEDTSEDDSAGDEEFDDIFGDVAE